MGRLPLIDRLGDAHRDVRMQAATMLGTLGIKAYAALPSLRKTLNDKSKGVQKAVGIAIDKIEDGLAD